MVQSPQPTHAAGMMTFAPELQDILGFTRCKGAGHIFAQDPRLEMARHYGHATGDDPYLGRRDTLHDVRTNRNNPPGTP